MNQKEGIEITSMNSNKILGLYQQKKMTRKELRLKFGLSYYQVEALLKNRGIELWDKKSKPATSVSKAKKKPNSKYFSLKDYKNHYFFNYNK